MGELPFVSNLRINRFLSVDTVDGTPRTRGLCHHESIPVRFDGRAYREEKGIVMQNNNQNKQQNNNQNQQNNNQNQQNDRNSNNKSQNKNENRNDLNDRRDSESR